MTPTIHGNGGNTFDVFHTVLDKVTRPVFNAKVSKAAKLTPMATSQITQTHVYDTGALRRKVFYLPAAVAAT